MNDDNLEKFINYAISNGVNPNLELEARFGTYNKISSNLRKDTFFKIFNTFKGGMKKYSYIKDIIYDHDKKKRTVINDPKAFTKNIFNNMGGYCPLGTSNLHCVSRASGINNIDEYSKQYSKLENKNNTYSLSKTQVFKPVEIKKIFKLVLVVENESKEIIDKPPTYQKNKFRCTILENCWNIDLTVVHIMDCKTKLSSVFYEVEIEFNYKSYIKSAEKTPLEDLKKFIFVINTIMSCTKNNSLEEELQYNIFNQVTTLERQHIPKLVNAQYAVTEKADGERIFIYIDNNKNIYRINPSSVILDKIFISKSVINETNTLIDGELITIDNKEIFLGFDILFYNNIDYRNFNLPKRLKCLKLIVASLNKYKINIKFTVKKFYMENIFNNSNYIWNKREQLFPYNLDGIIFTPIRGSYLSNLPILKWKDKHSIDIRMLYNKEHDFTYFTTISVPHMKKDIVTNEFIDHKTGDIFYINKVNANNSKNADKYKQFNLINNNGFVGIKGRLTSDEFLRNMSDIIELEYDISQKKWIFLRKRTDKERPNAFKTIISVLDAIIDDINIYELSKLKHISSEYDSISVGSCYNDIGFNFTASEISSEICNYYTYAYTQILYKIPKIPKKASALIIGCDICILKAVALLYTNIVVIEPNCLEVYGKRISEGYSGLKELAQVYNIKATIIWGKLDSGNLVSQNKKDQKLLQECLKKYKSFDMVFINSYSDLVYNNKFDKRFYMRNMELLKSLSNTIVGLYLDGDQIVKYLNKYDCIFTKNKDLHPLYKIHTDIKKINRLKYNSDIFDIAPTNIKLLEIQKLQNSMVAQYQPLIFNNNIQDLIKKIKLTPIECKSLKSFYSDFKQKGSILNDYDCIILDITKYFIIN
jgi:hypothetical protein